MSDWKETARERQLYYFEQLGSRNYDEIKSSDSFLLTNKVGYAVCGKPDELPSKSNLFTGYNEEHLKGITTICNQIKKNIYDDNIWFSCIFLIVHVKGQLFETPVFRIRTMQKGDVFIDAQSRVYKNWMEFIKTNKLPKCEYCYPVKGTYSTETLIIDFTKSPACKFIRKAINCLDTVGTVAGLGTASVLAVGGIVSVGPAVTATALGTGVYSIGRSVQTLVDRKKHEQPIGLSNPESRSEWLSILGSSVSFAVAGAVAKASKLINSGKSLSKLGTFGVGALARTSVAVSGFGFYESCINCVEKYKNNNLNKKDIFNLSCEILFLVNAIACAKATTDLLQKSTVVLTDTTSSQNKLTKTQKRNLQRKAAKRRAKGLPSDNPTNTSDTMKASDPKRVISFSSRSLFVNVLTKFNPRLSKISYAFNSIGHDIISWKSNKISFDQLILKTLENLKNLCKIYKEDILGVLRFFSSGKSKVITGFLRKLMLCATYKEKSDFFMKIKTVDTIIRKAEKEVNTVFEELDISPPKDAPDSKENNCECISEGNICDETLSLFKDINRVLGVLNISKPPGDAPKIEDDSCEDNSDVGLCDETQSLLNGCTSLVEKTGNVNNLKEYQNILDIMMFIVMERFKTEVSNYKRLLKVVHTEFKELTFDPYAFNRAIQIEGDVVQYMFNKALASVQAESRSFIMEMVCDAKKENLKASPVWEDMNIFHHFVPTIGNLSTTDLLHALNVVLQLNLSQNNCNISEKEGVFLITLKQEKSDLADFILVYCIMSEFNTASLMILSY